MIVPILFMVVGIFVFIMTYIDGKKRNAELTTSYMMHCSRAPETLGLSRGNDCF